MKKVLLFIKIVLFFNVLMTLALIAAFFLPHISPSKFGLLSLLSLFVPLVIFANVFFVLFWVLAGFKKFFFISLIALITGYFMLPQIFKFGTPDALSPSPEKSLKLLTYNVRKFNKFNWMKTKDVDKKIDSFITKLSPDIVALQEFIKAENFNLHYPYSYTNLTDHKMLSGLAIYSKFPIVNKGELNLGKTFNRGIYVDIVKDKDTLRIYSFHLQSLGLDPERNYIEAPKASKRLVRSMRYSFERQQEQIEGFNKQIAVSKYPVIIMGDMNNTAFSWAYKHFKNDFNDSFLEKGSRFGTTYRLKGFPLRIDYIFSDKKIPVLSHQNFDVTLSDHYPVMATVAW